MTTVLITGANRGLGLQTSRDLARKGWTVWLGARDVELGRASADHLQPHGDVRQLHLDVTDDRSVHSAVRTVRESGTGLDVLVNNAGISGARGIATLDTLPEHFSSSLEVNLLGPVRVTSAFLPLLDQSANPRIVMVSSGLGSLTAIGDPERLEYRVSALVYPASKAALNMVTAQYAKALPRMRVNAVDPGYTATGLNDFTGHQSVEEGARAIVRAASLGPDGPTGQFLHADGTVPW